MARRKRLSPTPDLPESDEMIPRYPMGVAPPVTTRRPPVAEVAADAATRAALDELAGEMAAARKGGRMIMPLPLDAIEAGHLLRDRLEHDPDDMAALKSSLAARGQQTPVEVVDLGEGRYGLISGARRLAALTALHEETGEARFAQVQCLLRSPDGAAGAYLAMVEENEIRADLSFYERGRLVAEAAKMGLFPDTSAAVKGLFGNATPARRSKILSFVALHEAIGAALTFPTAIPEKLGLALVGAFKTDSALPARLRTALTRAAPGDAVAERAVLDRALKTDSPPAPPPPEVAPGIRLEAKKGRLVLSGPKVDDDLAQALTAFLTSR